MEEKNQLVINYINNIRNSFEKNGHSGNCRINS